MPGIGVATATAVLEALGVTAGEQRDAEHDSENDTEHDAEDHTEPGTGHDAGTHTEHDTEHEAGAPGIDHDRSTVTG